jgi:hypothetical protein
MLLGHDVVVAKLLGNTEAIGRFSPLGAVCARTCVRVLVRVCVLVRMCMCMCMCVCIILVTQGITARMLRNDDCIGWVASYVVSKRCDDMVKMRLRASRAPCAKQHLRDLPIRYWASPETKLTFRSARATCA